MFFFFILINIDTLSLISADFEVQLWISKMASIWRFFGQSEPEIQKQPEITEEEKNEAISKVADAMLWTIEPVAHYWFLFLREASSIFHFALQDENSLREAVEELFWSGEIFVAFCSNAGKTASK